MMVVTREGNVIVDTSIANQADRNKRQGRSSTSS